MCEKVRERDLWRGDGGNDVEAVAVRRVGPGSYVVEFGVDPAHDGAERTVRAKGKE